MPTNPQSYFARNYGVNGSAANQDVAKAQVGYTYAIGDTPAMRVLPAVAQMK